MNTTKMYVAGMLTKEEHDKVCTYIIMKFINIYTELNGYDLFMYICITVGSRGEQVCT
jgi:hypothetical protein